MLIRKEINKELDLEEEVVETDNDSSELETENESYDESTGVEDSEQEEESVVVNKITSKHNEPKKPNIKKRSSSKGKNILKNKKVLIALGVVAFFIVVGILKSLIGGNKGSDQDYFTVLDTILNSDGGEFAYTITVNSGKHTEKGLDNDSLVIEEGTQSVESTETSTEIISTESSDIEQSKESEILESTSEVDNQKTLSAQTSEWGTKDGIALTEWKYPKYIIKITGACTSVEPYTAKLNIVLATENFSDEFTDIVAVDNAYYINVEQIKHWLENSKDSYLVSIANEMPDGSKYVQINDSDFVIPSRYAEDGEKGISGVKGLYNYKKRFLSLVSLVENTIKGYCELGSSSQDGYTMIANGENGKNIASAIKSIVTKSGDFYDSYINTLELTDDEKKQKNREKDNFISAMSKAMLYMNLTTTDAMNFQMSGNALTLNNGDNNKQYEASLQLGYTLNDTDYSVSISAQRVGSQVDKITVPDASTSNSLMSFEEITNIFNNVMDYFNFTDIELGKQLEPTPQNSVNNALQSFVDLVNENGCYSEVLSIHNVMNFLQKYSNIEERNATDENEKACIVLTNDFLNTFGNMITDARKQVLKDNVTGEETDKNVEQKDDNQGVEQYPKCDTKVDGVDLSLKVNAKKSTSRLLVIDCKVVNNTDKDVTFDETSFQVKTLLGSIYPANNRTLLGGYDSEWYNKYEKKISTELKVKAGGKKESTLYFVMSDDNGYMDIWYNDTNLGVVVQY